MENIGSNTKIKNQSIIYNFIIIKIYIIIILVKFVILGYWFSGRI